MVTAGHQDVVADRRAGARHLRAAQHDTLGVLLHYPDLDEVTVLLDGDVSRGVESSARLLTGVET